MLRNLGKEFSIIRCKVQNLLLGSSSSNSLFGVLVASGHSSVSSSRLRGLGPEVSPSCVLLKFWGAMAIWSMLTVGVSAFVIQPEEHTGNSHCFSWTGLACNFSGERSCLTREILLLSKSKVWGGPVVPQQVKDLTVSVRT